MRSEPILRLAELASRVVALAGLVTLCGYAVFGAGAGTGLPNGTPNWVWQGLGRAPLVEDLFEPTASVVPADRQVSDLVFALDKAVATSMLDPGVEQDPGADSYQGAEGVNVRNGYRFTASFDVGWGARVAIASLGALGAIGFAAFWWMLAGIIREARRGAVFTRRGVQRLVVMRGGLIVGPTGWVVANRVIDGRLLAESRAAGKFELAESWVEVPNYTTITLGLVLLALAVVWRRGSQLEEDVEGLV
ncbi:hypothetical protein BCF74_11940 [Knoellia remsis]|uniref:DUF2975 family protein n=1 Tax=Knoellia remsis TaxID=407159 RepID=A0A2T0UEH9_9MICO|nr:hypothetical protein [Knoellia remsis]PRY56323.1 hypothetical protein BCF74_11940 [Knoellia remsis]